MRDWYLPSEIGLVLTYEERFDGQKIGETRLEVLSLETGEECLLVLRRTRDGEETLERYRITPEGAWQDGEPIWSYPIRPREWETEDPRVGSIRHRLAFSPEPICVGKERFERVVLLTSASEGGQSTEAFSPQIGLLRARYLADGTPGETVLRKIERTKPRPTT